MPHVRAIAARSNVELHGPQRWIGWRRLRDVGLRADHGEQPAELEALEHLAPVGHPGHLAQTLHTFSPVGGQQQLFVAGEELDLRAPRIGERHVAHAAITCRRASYQPGFFQRGDHSALHTFRDAQTRRDLALNTCVLQKQRHQIEPRRRQIDLTSQRSRRMRSKKPQTLEIQSHTHRRANAAPTRPWLLLPSIMRLKSRCLAS